MGENPYAGQIEVYGFNFFPRNTYLCSGQTMAINADQALYSLIGTFYGGDGRVDFGIPDLRGRSMIGIGQAPNLSDVRLGEKRGAEYAAIPLVQHSHTAVFTPSGGSGGSAVYPVTGTITANDTTIIGDASLSATAAVSVDNANGTTTSPPTGGHIAITLDNFANPLRAFTSTPQGGLVNLASTPVTGTAATDGLTVSAPGIDFNLSVTLPGGGGGGTVTVGDSGVPDAELRTIPPQLGLTFTIASGLFAYPPRP